jgi:hypothetical protein
MYEHNHSVADKGLAKTADLLSADGRLLLKLFSSVNELLFALLKVLHRNKTK